MWKFWRFQGCATFTRAALGLLNVSQLKVCMSIQRFLQTGAVLGMALLSGPTIVSARQDPSAAPAPRVIEVTAKRFTFEPSTIEVTEGERVRLT